MSTKVPSQACSVILNDTAAKISEYDRIGLHYNLVANQVYGKRLTENTDPFSLTFISFVIAGLIAFDMRRLMGDKQYNFEENAFGSRLKAKLEAVKQTIGCLMTISLHDIDLPRHQHDIEEAYVCLSANGPGSLHRSEEDHFHVGATKILHFLNPLLFIIIDSNAARAFRHAHGVPFRKGTSPGYSCERYIECLECARKDITCYGLQKFQSLEAKTPITRIYDKLTFVTGSNLEP